MSTYTNLLKIAWRLARHYGHEWADVWEFDELDAQTADEIRGRVAAARHPHALPGIDAPALRLVDGEWESAHTTGTGRLVWDIHESGCLHLDVLRPTPDGKGTEVLVLRASISDEMEVTEVEWYVRRPCGTRHVKAAANALAAFDWKWDSDFSDVFRAAEKWDAYEEAIRALQAAQEDAWESLLK